MDMNQQLQQLRDDALTYLVLWAASREYSPDIEAVLKHWAATFEVPETELHNRIMAAADGKLAKPPSTVSSREQEGASVTQQQDSSSLVGQYDDELSSAVAAAAERIDACCVVAPLLWY
ncbi:hypothetical protein COO60DRAFT_1456813 [Scenedesmus sp. NREL 46B-D3]|nr:hypothetical protein COO60DRAFT_1456813 [Scenedesmus sp. NREL 46B-D3]